MAELWFTADTHYQHENVLRHDNRPFATIRDHDDGLIARYCECVKPNDTCIIVGDFAWRDHQKYLARLPGKKILIIGTHDGMPQEVLRNFTKVVGQKGQPGILEFNVGPHRLVCCHYPMVSWGASYHGSWHISAHAHGRIPEHPDQLRVDVGVPVWDYRPVNFEVIRRIMMDRREAWRARCASHNARDDERPDTVGATAKDHLGYLHSWRQDWDRGIFNDTDYQSRYRYCPNDTTNPKEQ